VGRKQIFFERAGIVKGQTYLKNVVSVELDIDKCVGCGMCALVCPHRVFAIKESKSAIVDRDACMECGACERNCPVGAIKVESGVGCAVAVLSGLLKRGKANCDCCCEPEKPRC
jgi:NAD-dependent dihydropyrimidine dehydrogenase PreA subunit